MTSITIRPFAADEWPLYKALRLRSLADSPGAFGSTLELESLRADDVWADRLRSGATSGKDAALVARVGDVPSGLVWAKEDAAAPDHVNVFQMWVAPEARGLGVGKALLDAALDWSRGRGAKVVQLGVAEGDTPANRLYRRAGFVAVGDPEPLRPGSDRLAINLRLHLRGE